MMIFQCLSDYEDELEEQNSLKFQKGHQRRLSDPSSSIDTWLRSGWKSKPNHRYLSKPNHYLYKSQVLQEHDKYVGSVYHTSPLWESHQNFCEDPHQKMKQEPALLMLSGDRS